MFQKYVAVYAHDRCPAFVGWRSKNSFERLGAGLEPFKGDRKPSPHSDQWLRSLDLASAEEITCFAEGAEMCFDLDEAAMALFRYGDGARSRGLWAQPSRSMVAYRGVILRLFFVLDPVQLY